ncbi:MAG TPA: hypothetical protein VFA55_01060 [Candidatus Kapabacteria bacterium]|nr:hypothetical protein [Candidatus Kapabacteria bacterium]
MKKFVLLIVAGVLYAGCLLALYTLGDLRSHLPRYFVLTTIPFIITFVVFRKWDFFSAGEPGVSGQAIRIVIFFAIAYRLALVALAPSLSDDLYRYVWDGRLLANGYNPYRYAPADSALVPFRDELYGHIAYKNYYSIYPPLAEAGFGASAYAAKIFFHGSTAATYILWKLLLTAVETGTMILLLRLLLRFGKPAKYLLLYAWHPLPIIEFAGQGHSDALMVFFIMAALYVLTWEKVRASAVYIGAAIASRAMPLIFLPAFARSIKIRGIIIAILLSACMFLPFFSPGIYHGILFSTSQMAQVFTFNSFGYWTVRAFFEDLRAWEWEVYIPLILGIIFISWFAVLAFRARKNGIAMLPKDMLTICTLFVLVLWNMHPWYFTWGLSLVPLVTSWGWVWLAFSANFTYLHYTPHSDAALLTVGVIEYGGFILLLLWQRIDEKDKRTALLAKK